MKQLTGYIGRKAIISVTHVLNLFAFSYKMMALIFKRPEQGGNDKQDDRQYGSLHRSLPVTLATTLTRRAATGSKSPDDLQDIFTYAPLRVNRLRSHMGCRYKIVQ